MDKLLKEIKACRVCKESMTVDCRPVLSVNAESKILIIGQAPGKKVYDSGKPWDDKSGENLRAWMGIDEATFYDAKNIGIVPMGFCFPGKGKSGDLPPRKECAPLWHEAILSKLSNVQLTLLIGIYAQQYYLGDLRKKTLTETVKNNEAYLPKYMTLPHPSPRNNIWMAKNKWFEKEVLPKLKTIVSEALAI